MGDSCKVEPEDDGGLLSAMMRTAGQNRAFPATASTAFQLRICLGGCWRDETRAGSNSPAGTLISRPN
jgi:hypothetical protein